ncbi:MAG: lamin tail domain-containing protein [Phycisphaerales bacterium]|nr:lamin tail domain-containing protein [Phycisphaerales bacterium]
MKWWQQGLVLALAAGVASTAFAGIYITEWMYDGQDGEFIEFTNLGAAPVDFTGWGFVDNNYPNLERRFDLSGFGNVQPGEAVVLTEAAEGDFRSAWALDPAIKVVGLLGANQNGWNIGRADSIILLDANDNIADRLDYGDQAFPGSIRTQRISGNPLTPAALGANDPYLWVLSFEGDEYGSYRSVSNDLGNPGYFVPEPAAFVLFALAAGLLRRR